MTVRREVRVAVEVRTVPVAVVPVDPPRDVEAPVPAVVVAPTRTIVSVAPPIVTPMVEALMASMVDTVALMAALLDAVAVGAAMLVTMTGVAVTRFGGGSEGQHERQRGRGEGEGDDAFHNETSLCLGLYCQKRANPGTRILADL